MAPVIRDGFDKYPHLGNPGCDYGDKNSFLHILSSPDCFIVIIRFLHYS